jgi:hypothetical protein
MFGEVVMDLSVGWTISLNRREMQVSVTDVICGMGLQRDAGEPIDV